MRLRRSPFEHALVLSCKVWPRAGYQWCAGHAGWSQTLRKLVVLTFVLFAGENPDCSLPLPQCRAPPQIGVIAGV